MTPLKTGGPPEISSKRSCGLDRTNRITVSTKGSIGLKPRRCHSNTAVVHARYTARLVRQHRLDGSPFVIVEFVVHDLRLRFWSLNHAPGDTINPQRPIGADDSALILLPLSEPQATWQDLPPASSQSKMTQLGHRLLSFSRRKTNPLHPISLVAVSSQLTGRTRFCVTDSGEASASSAMRLSARRSRRQSSRLIFCITITYA
jgi:hypothetical protein